MKADAIQRVSNAIALRLKDALPADPNLANKVVVAAPNDPRGKNAQLVIFPYKLMVNTALRNVERVLPPDQQGKPSAFEDSLPLDVFYLLTVGDPFTGDAELPIAPDSQVWLGSAIRALQRDPNLVGEAVDGDIVRMSLEPASTEEMNRIWSLFPNADYRTSVVYVASPVWIDPDAAVTAPRVVDDRRRVSQGAS